MTTGTQLDIELLEALAAEVESAAPCDWHTLVDVPVPECPQTARWVIAWREKCMHGNVIPDAGHPLLLCGGHRDEFVRGFGFWCVACDCPIWLQPGRCYHIASSVLPLNGPV